MEQYTIAYRFTPNGHWYYSDDRFDLRSEAEADMDNMTQTAKLHREKGLEFARYWKIVVREVSAWKDVTKQVEVK